MGAFLLEVCRRHRDREALVFDDPFLDGQTVRWTYGDLEAATRRVARGLLGLGVSRGDRVATLMANRPEAVAAYFGAVMAGAVVVPLSTFATRDELSQLITTSEASVLLLQTTMGRRDFAADIAALSPAQLRQTVAIGPDAERHGLAGWADFLEHGDNTPADTVDEVVSATFPDDPGLVIFSSGTTSAPKGMLHHHQAPTLQFWLQAELFGRHEDTRMWTALPLFWTAGMNTAMGATLAAGGCWVMQEGFDAGIALSLMERERVTEPYTLPHQATALAEHPDWLTTDLSSLRCVYGKSVFPRHPSVDGDKDWQMPVGWGMSETCAFISALPSNAGREAMKASLGRLLPGNRLRVADLDTGDTCPTDVDGELLIQGPTLMERYLGKAREECVDADGWFHTGDIGHVDAEQNIHWSGRNNELIKTGGANVAPAEIEVALRAFPAITLARVIAMPDPRLEQIAVLCVELREDAQVTNDDITGFLRERIASYKVPKQIVYFPPGTIPLTSSGTKVVDDDLRALVLARAADTADSTEPQ
jgi:acyl-CoA synthetase (AMP-forming)/AMP-acid ligase II